jgi:hypothetical protein
MEENRFDEVYNSLVDQTDNPATLHSRGKNELLKNLLAIFEYIRGEDDNNPIVELFEEE